jgi:hypothetical protein
VKLYTRATQVFVGFQRRRLRNIGTDTEIGEDATCLFGEFDGCAFGAGVAFGGDAVEVAEVVATFCDGHGDTYSGVSGGGSFLSVEGFEPRVVGDGEDQ